MYSESDAVTLRMLRVFRAAAAAETFSAAARTLDMRRAYVSREVARLESILGTPLFTRTTRRVCLTEAGQAFRAYAERGTDELWSGFDAALRTADGRENAIRLSVSGAFGLHYVLPMVEAFEAERAGAKVEVVLSEKIDDLHGTDLDLAIRMGSMQDSDIICRKLGEMEVVMAVPATLAARHGLPQSPADLGGMPAIEFRVPGTNQRYPWLFEGPNGVVRHDSETIVLTTTSIEMVAAALTNGRGVAPLPRYLAEPGVSNGTLAIAIGDWPMPTVPVHICFDARRAMTVPVRAFIDYACIGSPKSF